jgi:integrase
MTLTDIAIRRAKPREKPISCSTRRACTYWSPRPVESSGASNIALQARKRHSPSDPTPSARWQKPETSATRRESSCVTTSILAKSVSARSEIRRFGPSTPSGCSLTSGTRHSSPNGRPVTPRASRRLKVDLFPSLGDRPIAEIEAPELLETLRIIEKRGSHDIAHRVLQIAGQVFRYAIVLGRAVRDPSRDLKGALVVAGRVRHHAALREDELPEFIEKLDKFDGHLQTQLAMKLLLLTFVRTGELRGAKWIEFDFDKALWRIPATRMKTGREHIVPLSKQALEVLRELQKLHGHRLILFPNQAKPTLPMSENTILFALYRMGYHSRATGHGFRATASTILNEQGWRSEVIERQLAHTERNKVRAAYNRAEYLPERRELMQHWADFLDKIVREAREKRDVDATARA